MPDGLDSIEAVCELPDQSEPEAESPTGHEPESLGGVTLWSESTRVAI